MSHYPKVALLCSISVEPSHVSLEAAQDNVSHTEYMKRLRVASRKERATGI